MSGYQMKCFICEKEFHARSITAKYCSKECWKEKVSRTDTVRNRFIIFNRDGCRCIYCGATPEDGAKLSIDHIVPKKKGGKFTAGNLVTSCLRCNSSKGDTELTPDSMRYVLRTTEKKNMEIKLHKDVVIKI